jgi:hypothetical protein
VFLSVFVLEFITFSVGRGSDISMNFIPFPTFFVKVEKSS